MGDASCEGMAETLFQYQGLGYTIYRTGLAVRFDSNGGLPKGSKTKPEFVDEVFNLRLNRCMWRFHHKMKLAAWVDAVKGRRWQLLLTRDPLHSNRFVTKGM